MEGFQWGAYKQKEGQKYMIEIHSIITIRYNAIQLVFE